ncbi:MAG TPA: ATP-binding protein [Azospirillum sp.]|nr:ATP-binding protein [Azospirillum sp.]
MRHTAHLWIVALGTTFPVAILVTIGLLLFGNQHVGAVHRQLAQAAYSSVAAVENKISSDLDLLETLALDAGQSSADLAALYRRAKLVEARRPDWLGVVLTNQQGQVLNTSLAFGTTLPPLIDARGIETVLRTGRPHVSGVLRSAATMNEPVIILRAPVTTDGMISHTLAVLVRAWSFAELLREQGLTPEGSILLADQDHRLIARTGATDPQEGAIGSPVSQSMIQGIEQVRNGYFYATTLDGTPMMGVSARVTATGWTVLTVIPSAALVWEARWSLLLAVLGGVAVLATALAVTAVMLRARQRRIAAERERLGLEADRQAERRLAEIAANFPGIIYRRELRPDGRMAYTYLSPNRELVETAGRPPPTLNDWQPLDRVVEILPREMRLEWLAALRRSAETLTPFVFESSITDVHGHVRWVRSTAGVHRRGDGTVVWDGVLLDVTHIKRTEDALATAMREAERANTTKSRLLAAASHDLRQPFQAMSLFSTLLLAHLPQGEPRRIAERLDEAVRTAMELLNALLDLSTVESGTFTPVIGPVVVEDLLERLRREFEPLATAKGLILRVVPCGTGVLSDRVLLERMLRNLLVNALHFTERGCILVGCRRRGSELAIEVWDTGRGIPDEQQDAIFEDFYRIDGPEPVRHRVRGLGLGLAIVRRLAQLLGHRVGVQSRPGRGSCFRILAPRVGAPPRTLQPPAAERPARIQRILLVEDDEAQRSGLRLTLETWGHVAWAAADADGALALTRGGGERPTLIVSDYRLPGDRSGADLVRQIRGELGEDIPCILMTGGEDAAQMAAARGTGFRLLRKPFRPEDLADALSSTTTTPRDRPFS